MAYINGNKLNYFAQVTQTEIPIVQTIGDSAQAVMSQKAVTDIAFDARDAKIAVVDGEAEEIPLQNYPKVNFNLESSGHNTWTASPYYGCVLIPASELGRMIKIQPTSLEGRIGFLKDASVSANANVNFCDGVAYYHRLKEETTLLVPKDCKYLYVYIGDGTGEIHLFNAESISELTEIENAIEFKNFTISKFLFKRGTIVDYDGTGQFSSHVPYRIATVYTTFFSHSIEIKIAEGFDVHVSFFSEGVYQNSTGWCKSAVIEQGQEVKIMVKRVTENTAETADIDEFHNALSANFLIEKKFTDLEKKTADIEGDITAIKEEIDDLKTGDKFINLRDFNKINYNLEGVQVWASNSTYGGVLIPRNKLNNTLKIWSDTFKVVGAFLRDDNIIAGKTPNYCMGTSKIYYTAGIVKEFTVPSDCEYLYIYVSIDNHDLISVEPISVYKEIESVKNVCGMPVYISDIDQVIRTIKHRHDGAESGFVGTNVSDDLLVLAHISDVHYDTTVYRRFIDFLNNNTPINAGVVTGDIIDYPKAHEYEGMLSVESNIDDSNRLIKAMGNHEMLSTSMTPTLLYERMGMNTNTGKLYYYKDYDSQKVRLIVLNQYDVVSDDLYVNGGTNHFTMEQINWFIDTLNGATANGYAVIIAYHSCEAVGLPKWNNKGFCQNVSFTRSSEIISDSVIEDIVNAWQTGGTLNKTYTYTDIDTVLNINVSFTQNGLFVCYLCGHEHVDYIGYSPKYPSQLICMVQGAVVDSNSRSDDVAHWQSKYDTPRVANTSTMDSINVYGIDVKNRVFKVAKIGSTLTDKFVPRSFATFGF